MAQPPRPILLVEDDPNDVLLLERALRRCQISVPLRVAKNSVVAMEYLSGAGAFTNRGLHPFPMLVLLDLKMPGGSGIELVTWIRERPGTGHMPVIMLTSSSERSDVDGAYEAGCNAYLVKPVAFEALQTLMGRFGRYWIGVNVTPQEQREVHGAQPTER